MRKIIHIDMDAFYAAIEQRDDPSLRGRPVAVGSSSARGVVMTASYEARRFGVGSAMPSARAMRLCPDLVFVRPRFELYRDESRRIRSILARFSDLIEPVALDEAYLDVTVPKCAPTTAVAVAEEIRCLIAKETGLTASAGVSFNKFLAKTASGLAKPNGLKVIRPDQAMDLLARMPIERFHGVGPVTARRMRACGIITGADLQARQEHELVARFGRMGAHYWRMAQAHDSRAVLPDRARRSLSVERTFAADLTSEPALGAQLEWLAAELAARIERAKFEGRTLSLKIRYADFSLASRSTTRCEPFCERAEILAAAAQLLASRPRTDHAIRLLGLGVGSRAGHETRQLDLRLMAGDNAVR